MLLSFIVIPEGCPPINMDSVGVCGGNMCSTDDECWLYSPQTKCCPSACGGSLCTMPYGENRQIATNTFLTEQGLLLFIQIQAQNTLSQLQLILTSRNILCSILLKMPNQVHAPLQMVPSEVVQKHANKMQTVKEVINVAPTDVAMSVLNLNQVRIEVQVCF